MPRPPGVDRLEITNSLVPRQLISSLKGTRPQPGEEAAIAVDEAEVGGEGLDVACLVDEA